MTYVCTVCMSECITGRADQVKDYSNDYESELYQLNAGTEIGSTGGRSSRSLRGSGGGEEGSLKSEASDDDDETNLR